MTDLNAVGQLLLEREVLPKYCEWLNAWVADEKYFPGTMRFYSPEQFLVTDPNQSLWGDSKVNGGMEVGASAAFERILFNYAVYDGDDGGPTELTAWFERTSDDEVWTLVYLIQGFDTTLQPIYDTLYMHNRQSPWLNLPTKEEDSATDDPTV